MTRQHTAHAHAADTAGAAGTAGAGPPPGGCRGCVALLVRYVFAPAVCLPVGFALNTQPLHVVAGVGVVVLVGAALFSVFLADWLTTPRPARTRRARQRKGRHS